MMTRPPMAIAVLGGGCFWCLEGVLRSLSGVSSVLPAYAGGEDPNPDYNKVCSGETGHAEVVVIEYDAETITFATLLEVFFTMHDPTQLNRQGNDVGTQYRSCIMPMEAGQAEATERIMEEMKSNFDSPIVTTIEKATNLTIAEEYHHDYFAKNPDNRYCQVTINPKLAKVRARFSHLL